MNSKIMLTITGVVAITAVIFFYTNYSLNNPSNISNETPTVKVVATFYPLAHFAKQIGQDHVRVTTITPAGAEPHDYEPTPKEIAETYQANLFLANGSGLDPWAEKIIPELHAQHAHTVVMSDTINLLPRPQTEEDFSNDPHFWLDPTIAQQIVNNIKQALQKIDPNNAQDYEINASKYREQLQQLDQAYETGLSKCVNRAIITSHAAFGYVAKRYNLRQVAIAGLNPEQEPSAERLAQITKLARQNRIRYIFFETLVSPKLAETLAREISAQTLVFNPLEGLSMEQLTQGENYISIMEQNLQNLRTALECN